MCDLAGDMYLCLFGKSGLHRTVNFAARIRTPGLLELPSFFENHFASTQINGKCQRNDEPDWTIEDRNAKKIPGERDPAPELLSDNELERDSVQH
jgi:hypothetical protein